jgi:Fe-S-cluster containining protein
MLFEDADILHIPSGINYECTGCGNCCLQWPVPSTADDRQRIIDLSRELEVKGQLFRRVEMDVIKNSANQFQYTLEKRSDGRCIFLTENNRCQLHERFGAEAKPGMCQLFPYTFTDAPDGFYASVSFASSGALFNQGKPLLEQRDHLTGRLTLFKKLFPGLHLNWSQIQLFDGHPIRWANYLLLERDILDSLGISMQKSGLQQADPTNKYDWSAHLLSISDFLLSKVPPDADLERAHLMPSSDNLDLLLVRYLLELYFPEDLFTSQGDEPPIRALMQEMLGAPNTVSIKINGEPLSLADICATQLATLDLDSENLITRYLYTRIFSKLYFGAGMAHFSLIAGFHHLAILAALIRIKIKCLKTAQVDLLQVAEIVRSLERKLTSFQHSAESAAILQVLFESPSRFKRIISLAS